VHAVSGGCADDDVFQGGAVGEAEQRVLTLVLAAAAQVATADEAAVGAVERAADRLGLGERHLARGRWRVGGGEVRAGHTGDHQRGGGRADDDAAAPSTDCSN
jgi:hypothetical protein